MKKKWFIGVDVSKTWIDVSCLESDSTVPSIEEQFENSLAGFDKLRSWLEKNNIKPEDCLFCLEHTGTYMLMLLTWLNLNSIDTVVEPALQIKRSIGIQRGKNDQIDARRIAEYASVFHKKLKLFELPSMTLLSVKQLLSYRQQLVKSCTMFKNSLKNHLQYNQLTNNKQVTEDIEQQIERLKESITSVEKQIYKTLESDQMVKKNFDLSKSVKGIGLILAAMIVVNSNNFTSFTDARKFNCYTGVAPFEYSSGSSIRGSSQTSHLGNKILKSLLMNGANSAARYDSELRNYYKRKRAEGKDHKLVMNAIAAKLIGRVFAVVKRQSPYVETYKNIIEIA